jgi:hypothetical protein
MPAWLDRLTRTRPDRGGVSLARQLRDYPAYAAPHAGPAATLTPPDAQRNLEYLLAQRDARLLALGNLLAPWGIDIAAPLAGADPRPLLDALHRWAGEQWPALHEPALATRERWLRSSRGGAEIVYSMLMDLAILLGELIVRRRATYRWAIDLDEVNGRDAMTSYLRPVLEVPRSGDMPSPVILDVEEIVVSRYLRPNDPGLKLMNLWARLVGEAVAGAHEAPWQADPPAR